MPNYNRVIIGGNLVRDPDLKYTSGGTPVCEISIAVNHYFKDDKGQKQEQATFVPVTLWGKQATNTAEFMKKGRTVLIEGRLKQDKWTSKDGQKRQRITVVANMIRFLGSPPKAGEGSTPIEREETPPAEADAQGSETDENIPF